MAIYTYCLFSQRGKVEAKWREVRQATPAACATLWLQRVVRRRSAPTQLVGLVIMSSLGATSKLNDDQP